MAKARGKHSEATKTQALQLYASYGLNEATRRMRAGGITVAKTTISKWAKAANLKPPLPEERLTPQVARGKTFHKTNRLKLNDRLFRRVETLLKNEGIRITPNKLKDLSITYAILTQRRREEENDSKETIPASPDEVRRMMEEARSKVERMVPRDSRNLKAVE